MTTQTTDLQSRIQRISKTLNDGVTGPLKVAKDVLELAEQWDDKYRHDADGVAFPAYLRRVLGPGRTLRFFKQRAAAVDALGGIRGAAMMHHGAASWLSTRGLTPDATERVLAKVAVAFNAQNKNPLSQGQLLPLYQEVAGAPTKKARDCAGCAQLREELAALRAGAAL